MLQFIYISIIVIVVGRRRWRRWRRVALNAHVLVQKERKSIANLCLLLEARAEFQSQSLRRTCPLRRRRLIHFSDKRTISQFRRKQNPLNPQSYLAKTMTPIRACVRRRALQCAAMAPAASTVPRIAIATDRHRWATPFARPVVGCCVTLLMFVFGC